MLNKYILVENNEKIAGILNENKISYTINNINLLPEPELVQQDEGKKQNYALILPENSKQIRLLHSVTELPIYIIVNNAIKEYVKSIQENPLDYIQTFFDTIDLMTVFELISSNVEEELNLKVEKKNK